MQVVVTKWLFEQKLLFRWCCSVSFLSSSSSSVATLFSLPIDSELDFERWNRWIPLTMYRSVTIGLWFWHFSGGRNGGDRAYLNEAARENGFFFIMYEVYYKHIKIVAWIHAHTYTHWVAGTTERASSRMKANEHIHWAIKLHSGIIACFATLHRRIWWWNESAVFSVYGATNRPTNQPTNIIIEAYSSSRCMK